MGFRLEGPRLAHARGADIISDATPLGVLQVPASGQPILLMADRQTTGGYPKIATVITADIGLAGQLGPGDHDRVRRVLAARSDGGADRAGARADGRRAGYGEASVASGMTTSSLRRRWSGVRRRPAGRRCPLAPLTTFRVGGPAEWLIETRSSDEIVTALALAHRAGGVPVTMLGGGSNVLVSDAGVRGLVIRPRGGDVRAIDEGRVRADAAVTINGLVRWTINHGCAGLEAWAGTPGTVGGAVFGNAHFGGRLIGDLVAEVRGSRRATAPRSTCGEARWRSATTAAACRRPARFCCGRCSASPPAIRPRCARRRASRSRSASARSRSTRRAPAASFRTRNPGATPCPTGSRGRPARSVDRAGLKGAAVGGARVSPTHGNFIVNDGTATARDIRQLIERCRTGVREQFGVELREEIVYLGTFD